MNATQTAMAKNVLISYQFLLIKVEQLLHKTDELYDDDVLAIREISALFYELLSNFSLDNFYSFRKQLAFADGKLSSYYKKKCTDIYPIIHSIYEVQKDNPPNKFTLAIKDFFGIGENLFEEDSALGKTFNKDATVNPLALEANLVNDELTNLMARYDV